MASGIERAVFGEGDPRDWLDAHLRTRLGTGVGEISFHAGRLAAVYGLRLEDGSDVVVKVHRPGTGTERLAAAVRVQKLLAERGLPCPAVLDGPAAMDGLVAVVERPLEAGEAADAHRPEIRHAMAAGLAAQIEQLRDVPAAEAGLTVPPAWLDYAGGPWPVPHDPIFDFATTPPDHAWLDEVAAAASRALGPREPPDAIAHSDWVCQNLRFDGGAVVAAYDWDSLVAHTEPVLAGTCAAAYTEGSTEGDESPSPDEVAAFLADYDAARPRPFDGAEQAAAAAAATWVLAYNARCALQMGGGRGGPLEQLGHHRTDYLDVRW